MDDLQDAWRHQDEPGSVMNSHIGDSSMKTRELAFNPAPSLEWTQIVTEARAKRTRLGEAGKVGKWYAKYRLFLGESPIAISAEQAARKLGMKLKPWTRLAGAGNRSWLIRNTFSLMSEGSLLEPDAVGIEIIYRDDRGKLNRGMPVHVHSLLPGPEFHEFANGGVSARLDANGRTVCQARMHPHGQFDAEAASAATGAPLNAEGTLRGEAQVDGSIALRLSLFTTRVIAIGTGDRRAQWEFRKSKEPLIGQDIETWTGLLLSADEEEIAYRARIYAIFGFGPFRGTYSSEWVKVTCALS